MKPDEEHCRWALERYLREQQAGLYVALEEGADPPDYVAIVGDQAFNVEVTGIVAGVLVGDRVHDEVGLFASLTEAAEALCSQLQSEPWLSGAYAIHLEPVPKLKHELPGLVDRCTAYARETVRLDTAPEQRLPFHWSIKKCSNSRPLVGYTLSASDPSWEGEIQEELSVLVGKAVARKRTLAAMLPGFWVLVLLDRYHVALERNWLSVAAAVENDHFQAMFLVGPHGECRPLAGGINVGDVPPKPSLQRTSPG